jgi:glutathione S-transferase
MALTLYMHPLSSFCMKALVALYEAGTDFDPVVVDLGDPASRAAFLKVWPIGKFPVLRDGERVVPESTIIIEYLVQYDRGAAGLIPADPDRARDVRRWDRFFDLSLQVPMQKIVGDRLRPDGAHDPVGVGQAREALGAAYDVLEAQLAANTWATGDDFTMADCAAAPAVFYADKVRPLTAAHPRVADYLRRLVARPSFARVLAEAGPYFANFPG